MNSTSYSFESLLYWISRGFERFEFKGVFKVLYSIVIIMAYFFKKIIAEVITAIAIVFGKNSRYRCICAVFPWYYFGLLFLKKSYYAIIINHFIEFLLIGKNFIIIIGFNYRFNSNFIIVATITVIKSEV